MNEWTNSDTINEITCMLAALDEGELTKAETRALDAIYDKVAALDNRYMKRVSIKGQE